MATASEVHVSSGMKPVRNLCYEPVRSQCQRQTRRSNVSLRSVCLRFTSSLALAAALNRNQLFQLLSAPPKKDRSEWPPVTPLIPLLLCPLYYAAVFLGIKQFLLAHFSLFCFPEIGIQLIKH